MLDFFKKPFFNPYPRLDWIQIDISSYCGAECIYCPHTAYQKNWANRYLDDSIYELLRPAFQKTRLVYLQGWGEPFTHPNFFKFLDLAKRDGAMVGTTTNGTLITQQAADQIVDKGLDILCFSLAGIDKKNDAIRKGAPLKKVLHAIEKIHRAKNKYKTDRPGIHIAFMLLRSGLSDLEKLPDFVSETGANQTVVSSLSLVTRRELIKESMLVESEKEWPELRQRFLDIRSQAASRNTDIHFHIVAPFSKRTSCSENSSRALVIGSDGTVSPCVMKNLPVNGKIDYYFNNQKITYQPLNFGNIRHDPLNLIWNSPSCRNFRKKSLRYPLDTCTKCCKLFIDPISPADSYWV